LKDYLFKNICSISDRILNSKESNSTTIAIRSLHLIKNHPDYLNQHKKIDILKIFLLLVKRLFFSTINTFLLKSNLENIKFIKKKIIFISHLLEKENVNKKNDFYYGNFQSILNKRKISNYKIFCNHTNNITYYNNLKYSKNTIVLSKFLNLKGEIKLLANQLIEFFRLIRIKFKTKDALKKRIIKDALVSLFQEETLFALRINYQLKILFDKIKPKLLICTYEGYPWERLCFNKAKNLSKDLACVGYQHAPVIKSNYSLKRNLKGNYNPDIIWCSNNNSYNELLHSSKIKNTYLNKLGNFKSYQEKTPVLKKNKINKICLVIPEGTNSECIRLFKFSLLCAKKNKSFKFIWRVHPIIKKEKMLKLLDLTFHRLPSNIKISNNKLISKDFEKTSFTLYRGSGAIIKSTLFGNIPLYLNDKREANIDPLYKFNKKNYIFNVKDFNTLCNFYLKKNKLDLKLIRNINKNYYKKFEINKLLKFINKFK
tara:strand:- start:1749 stop:3203 length:1455 start_codon:yes stop_codon:yes gene_type:complete